MEKNKDAQEIREKIKKEKRTGKLEVRVVEDYFEGGLSNSNKYVELKLKSN